MTKEGAPPLTVSGVSASYGKKVILRDISFSLAPAEVFGLVGLNGAGKTTLIRSILNLRVPDEGEALVFGETSAKPQARSNLIYLPERFHPAAQLKGWEYLSILLKYFGRRVDRERATALAIGLDLEPTALDRRVRTYSKGMGQKLGLLGTILADAPLLILDEPMSGLDPRARVLLKDLLMRCRNDGRCIFFSSHILSDIEEICDRIGIIHDGRLIFLGTPGEFVARYAAPTLERAFLVALEQAEYKDGAARGAA